MLKYLKICSIKSFQKDHLKETQKQVDEVLDLMRDNVDKVMERGEKMIELDERAHSLSACSTQFAQQTSRLRQVFWWSNMKWTIILVILSVVVIILILLKIFL